MLLIVSSLPQLLHAVVLVFTVTANMLGLYSVAKGIEILLKRKITDIKIKQDRRKSYYTLSFEENDKTQHLLFKITVKLLQHSLVLTASHKVA